MAIKDTTKAMECSPCFVFKVKKMLNNCDDLSRKHGHNKKLENDFFTSLIANMEADMEADPAMDLNVSKGAISNAVGDLCQHSYVSASTPTPLLPFLRQEEAKRNYCWK